MPAVSWIMLSKYSKIDLDRDSLTLYIGTHTSALYLTWESSSRGENTSPLQTTARVMIMFWRFTATGYFQTAQQLSKMSHVFSWHIILKTNAVICYHYNDVIMGAMAPQITSVSIVYSTAGSGRDQSNITVSRHWPLWGEFTDDRWIPLTKGQ